MDYKKLPKFNGGNSSFSDIAIILDENSKPDVRFINYYELIKLAVYGEGKL